MGKRWRHFVALLGLLSAIGGCGPSQEQLDQAQDQVSRLRADLDAANRRHADDERKYVEAENQIEELKAHLLDLSKPSAVEQDLRERLVACQNSPARDCRAPATIAVPESLPVPEATSPAAPNIPYPGNGGGPTLCSDGSISGSSGRGTCSHHGGVAGGRRGRH